MYELEVDHASLGAGDLPESVLEQFAAGRNLYRAVALVPWEEHCTECAMPECYATCDLYSPRSDGKCRRFRDGFGYVAPVPSAFGYVVKVSFKRWGQLLGVGDVRLVGFERARRVTRAAAAFDRFVSSLPGSGITIAGRAGIPSRLTRRAKRRLVRSGWLADAGALPDAFVLEVFNPSDAPVGLTVVIRAHGDLRDRPYQKLVALEPGFHRVRIPYDEIAPHVDPTERVDATLNPNLLEESEEGLSLYFGIASFVSDRDSPATSNGDYTPAVPTDGGKHVKVLAWDLDNTLWDGILVEDGEEALELRPGILDVLCELDRRGIVNSVISKNDPGVALPVLERLGVAEYLVFPQISWKPKSESLFDLIGAFNVGADTIAVIDDSPFERAEMTARCPGVRVYEDDTYMSLPSLPEFRPALSSESGRRRKLYQAEGRRIGERGRFDGDYLSFLRDCRIRVDVRSTTPDTVARAHELIQRTNQLNFSGNRYDRAQVEELVKDPGVLALSIFCEDRFGEYGQVGFCLVDVDSATVLDLMLSCRVQAKRVEHAFLSELLRRFRARGATELRARYRKTEKNTQAGTVFADLGFDAGDVSADGTMELRYDLMGGLPEQDVIDIVWLGT